jgi:hypothetical protein
VPGRGQQLTLSLKDTVPISSPAVMLWIEASDGRLARHSVDVRRDEGGYLGTFFVSDIVLGQFQNGRRLEITSDGKPILETDMKGTGAARLAFLEHFKI